MRDGKIVAIGPELAAPAGVTVVDARGRWVTPGIVDIHTHLGDFPFPFASTDFNHSDVGEVTDPNTAGVWAEHSITVQDPAFMRAIAAGVTTVQVLPGSANLFGDWQGRYLAAHQEVRDEFARRIKGDLPAKLGEALSAYKEKLAAERTVGADETAVSFYRMDADGTREKLLTIYRLTGDMREELGSIGDRFALTRQVEAVYAAEIGETWNVQLTEQSLRERFSLIMAEWVMGDN